MSLKPNLRSQFFPFSIFVFSSFVFWVWVWPKKEESRIQTDNPSNTTLSISLGSRILPHSRIFPIIPLQESSFLHSLVPTQNTIFTDVQLVVLTINSQLTTSFTKCSETTSLWSLVCSSPIGLLLMHGFQGQRLLVPTRDLKPLICFPPDRSQPSSLRSS